MKENWPQSYKLVRQSEGGNDDDPDDHGGRTSRGITNREYLAWRHERGLTPQDVFSMSEEECETIYHDEYWEPYCDMLPIGTDYLFFDMSVNAGPHQAAILLQRALGVVADGRIGPITRGAIRDADPVNLIARFSDKKAEFYRSLHQPKYLKGWLNRVTFSKANALKMVKGQS